MENIRRGASQIVWPRKPHACAHGSCVAALVHQRDRALARFPREAVMTEDALQLWLRSGRLAARPGTNGRPR